MLISLAKPCLAGVLVIVWGGFSMALVGILWPGFSGRLEERKEKDRASFC